MDPDKIRPEGRVFTEARDYAHTLSTCYDAFVTTPSLLFLALALAGLFLIICAILVRSKRSAHHGGILIDNSTTNIALHLTV